MSNTQILGVRFINLCPHEVRLIRDEGEDIILPRPQKPARVNVRSGEQIGEVDGVSILGPSEYREISNLPVPEEGTFFIVSQITALAAQEMLNRCDLVYPGTTPTDKPVRGPDGELFAVRCLVRPC